MLVTLHLDADMMEDIELLFRHWHWDLREENLHLDEDDPRFLWAINVTAEQ